MFWPAGVELCCQQLLIWHVVGCIRLWYLSLSLHSLRAELNSLLFKISYKRKLFRKNAFRAVFPVQRISTFYGNILGKN